MFVCGKAADDIHRLYKSTLAEASQVNEPQIDQEILVIRMSGIFDPDHYQASRGIDFPDADAAIQDYVAAGAAAGASPNFYFDTAWYSARHPHLAALGINPFAYYLLVGAFQNHNPSLLFDSSWYLKVNTDVDAARVNPLVHYMTAGWSEKRDPIPMFDSAWYLIVYPDIAATGENPFLHYLRHGAWEGRYPNPLFDSGWYLATYPDIAAAGVNPLIHYQEHGAAEGRRPNPVFDSRWYAAQHPEAAGTNPLAHYLRFRTDPQPEAFPEFDGPWYLRHNPDVASSGADPLVHYVRHGRFEGRPAKPQAPRDRIVMDADRAMPAEDFALFRASCLAAAPAPAAPAEGLMLRIVVNVPVPEARDRVPATIAAVAALDLPAGVSVELVIHDPQGVAWSGLPAEPLPAHIAFRMASDRFLLLSALRQVIVRDVVLFLAAGDRPDPSLPAQLAGRFTPETSFALVDLHMTEGGRVFPLLLPGINPIQALNADYFRSRFVADGRAVRSILAVENAFDPRRLALRVLAAAGVSRHPDAALHIALPLLEIADSPAAIAGERRDLVLANTSGVFVTGPRDQAAERLTVSMVICTKDNEHLITQLVRSILALGPDHRIANIVIVPSDPENPYADRVFRDMPKHEKLVFQYFSGPFNFSAKCNLGARAATGDILLFLNDDIVPVSDNWLEDLLAPFANPRIAATAPLLVYPNGKVQHAGMYVGSGGACGHALRFARLPEEDYGFLGSVPRNVTVATGAALAVRRRVFEALEGFEERLANYIQDVDLCLRIRKAGHDIVMNPRSVMIHMETTTLKEDLYDDPVVQARGREFDLFMGRWRETLERGDPYHNPHFVLGDERLRSLALRNGE